MLPYYARVLQPYELDINTYLEHLIKKAASKWRYEMQIEPEVGWYHPHWNVLML